MDTLVDHRATSADRGSRVPLSDPAAMVGVGFKHEHAQAISVDGSYQGFVEVHAENYMGAGGMPHHILTRVRRDHPVSLHGVSTSIGGQRPIDVDHLRRFAHLVKRYEPFLVSEHLAWSTHGPTYLNDLLPLPYTQATLSCVCDHIDQVQEAIARPLLLENPATYVTFSSSEMTEGAFIREVADRTGCNLLLDLNNVFVSATNHGYSAEEYIESFPLGRVREIHLAGHVCQQDDTGQALLIDSHDAPVAAQVWSLFEDVLSQNCFVPTLIEWDSRLPEWTVLKQQADSARRRLSHAGAARAEEPGHAQ